MLPFPQSRLGCRRQDEQRLPVSGHVAHAACAHHAVTVPYTQSSEQSHLRNQKLDSRSLCSVRLLDRGAADMQVNLHRTPPSSC